MLKTEQMEIIVGAVIGMLEENLSEENDPKKKEEIINYKKQMEELYEQIMFIRVIEHLQATQGVVN
jgi:hypothetical protein